MATGNSLKTIMGMSRSNMEKILLFSFPDLCYDVKISAKTTSFIVFIDEGADESLKLKIQKYWKDLGIEIDYMHVINKRQPKH